MISFFFFVFDPIYIVWFIFMFLSLDSRGLQEFREINGDFARHTKFGIPYDLGIYLYGVRKAYVTGIHLDKNLTLAANNTNRVIFNSSGLPGDDFLYGPPSNPSDLTTLLSTMQTAVRAADPNAAPWVFEQTTDGYIFITTGIGTGYIKWGDADLGWDLGFMFQETDDSGAWRSPLVPLTFRTYRTMYLTFDEFETTEIYKTVPSGLDNVVCSIHLSRFPINWDEAVDAVKDASEYFRIKPLVPSPLFREALTLTKLTPRVWGLRYGEWVEPTMPGNYVIDMLLETKTTIRRTAERDYY